jgi:hypothetical protein
MFFLLGRETDSVGRGQVLPKIQGGSERAENADKMASLSNFLLQQNYQFASKQEHPRLYLH